MGVHSGPHRAAGHTGSQKVSPVTTKAYERPTCPKGLPAAFSISYFLLSSLFLVMKGILLFLTDSFFFKVFFSNL